MNDRGVNRTAPATPGLCNMKTLFYQIWIYKKWAKQNNIFSIFHQEEGQFSLKQSIKNGHENTGNTGNTEFFDNPTYCPTSK